jgi:hypothetical protein
MALEDDVDALYGLPLDEFTTARNDLAKRLRAERRPDEAAEVAALRKPSVAAWVVNGLVRERRDDVRALLAAADAIRGGAEDGDARFRDAVDALARGARELLVASGRAVSDTVVQEVVTTLRTLAATDADALESGRLTEGREASGFDALAGGAPPPAARRRREAPRPATKDRKPAVDRAAVEAARKALADARVEARAVRKALVAAEREAERAREALERAEERVDSAKAGLDAARDPGRGG